VFTLGGKWRGRVHPDHANRAFWPCCNCSAAC
jgi:hypothetical protein